MAVPELHELSIKTSVPEYHFVLTDPTTIALQLPGRVVVIDKKTGKVIKVVSEKPSSDPWIHKLSEAISGITQILYSREDLGVEKPDPWPLKPDPFPLLFRLSEAVSAIAQVLRTTEGPVGVDKPDPFPYIKLSEAVASIAQILDRTEGVQAAEELRLEAGKVLTILVERLSQKVQAGKPATHAA